MLARALTSLRKPGGSSIVSPKSWRKVWEPGQGRIAWSVSAEIQHQYQGYFSKFEDFCKLNGVGFPISPLDADPLLADFLDLLYLDGKSAREGEKTVAALEFHQIALKGHLPRSKRALRGWRKAVLPSSRLPMPRPVMFGLAMNLLAENKTDMALLVLVAFHLYLRLGEGLDLRKKNVVPPVRQAGKQFQHITVIIRDQEDGRPDKIAVFDNSLPLDDKRVDYMGSALLDKAKSVPRPTDRIFNFSMEDFRKAFVKAGEDLGLASLHPYQLRHGGATEDLASKRRDFQGVKARGRWKTDQSVRRYAKIGRIQQLLAQMTSSDKSFCKWSEMNMRRMMSGQLAPKKSK